MTILSSELKRFKSATITDTSANGGKMSATESVSAVKNNLFPDVSEAERVAGKTRHRKQFAKVANDADETLFNGRLHLTQHTPGQDYITFFPGTQINTQGDITGSERQYGAGALKTNVAAGATSFVVTIENSVLTLFVNGDMVWIGDGVNSEYHDNVTISKTGADVTITLDTGDQLANAYTVAAGTVGASVYQAGDVKGSVDGWSETSAAGTYDETGNPVEIDNIGSIEDTFTITFSDASNFSCSGAGVGSVGTGNISTDFAPNNPNFSKPFFTLRAAGWGGTWANGDTVVFSTHPAALPIWFKQIVPAGCASYSSNNFKTLFGGESA
jgi:LysM repeat protein